MTKRKWFFIGLVATVMGVGGVSFLLKRPRKDKELDEEKFITHNDVTETLFV